MDLIGVDEEETRLVRVAAEPGANLIHLPGIDVSEILAILIEAPIESRCARDLSPPGPCRCSVPGSAHDLGQELEISGHRVNGRWAGLVCDVGAVS